MKVIYCVSELLDWIDVAYYFKNKNNWQPIIWLTTQKNAEYFNSKFPETQSIDFFEANRGNLNSINLQRDTFLSKKLLIKYLNYEKIAINMMDRMDPTARNFNNSERVQLYYNILEFSINYIKKNRPDYIIFSESPHSVFTYLIYAVGVEEGIPIVRFSPTHIEGKTFLTSTIESEPNNFHNIYKNIESKGIISNEVKEYLKKINNKYNAAVPYYMETIVKVNQKSIIQKVILSSLKSIDYLFKRKKRLGYYKIKDSSIKKNFSNQLLAYSSFKATFYKIKLQKEYQKYVKLSKSSFDLEEVFIYFPLQYQPEKSTVPEGSFFADQFLAINMLSRLSSNRFKIYVKEHISQFSPKLKGEQGRVLNFYKELSLLDGIVFVDTSVNSFTLIDKSIAVSTITGTAGFESVVRATPSIIFGYPWYKNCHGIFFVQEAESLQEVLDKILINYQIDSQKIEYFLETIFQVSHEIYINPSNLKAHKDSEHDNGEAIINLLENELNR